MDNKTLMRTITDLRNLMEQPSSWRIKRQIKKTRRAINKLIRMAAKTQAKIAYDQTYQLYQDILESNLQ